MYLCGTNRTLMLNLLYYNLKLDRYGFVSFSMPFKTYIHVRNNEKNVNHFSLNCYVFGPQFTISEHKIKVKSYVVYFQIFFFNTSKSFVYHLFEHPIKIYLQTK